jgi:SAM-dependent methyltransferase
MKPRKIDPTALVCPVCKSEKMDSNGLKLYCQRDGCAGLTEGFRFVDGKPVLIDFSNSLISGAASYSEAKEGLVRRSGNRFKSLVRDMFQGHSRITLRNIEYLISLIPNEETTKILIVGGAQIGVGIDRLYRSFPSNIISLDLYNTKSVDIIADAHSIPFRDGVFDIVVIQAVLEHVLVPEKVVSEIYRVLKPGGIVYAETPFMQQVHEGPYDFTRFTESGHRYLFRNYKLIRSGFTAGAGSTLLWSLDFFFSGIFRTRIAGKLAQILFFWLRFLDRLIPDRYNIDAACGVFFMGSKDGEGIQDKSILGHYKGNQLYPRMRWRV